MSTSQTNDRRIEQLGQIAIRNRLVSPAQLEECLGIQRRMRELCIDDRLGRILVEKGYLTDEQLEDLLQIQRHMIARYDEELDGGDSVLFGHLLAMNKLVPEEEVRRAVEIQREILQMGLKRPLGEILLSRGLLSSDTLRASLRIQRNWLGHGFRASGYRFPSVYLVPAVACLCCGAIILGLIHWLPYREPARSSSLARNDREDPRGAAAEGRPQPSIHKAGTHRTGAGESGKNGTAPDSRPADGRPRPSARSAQPLPDGRAATDSRAGTQEPGGPGAGRKVEGNTSELRLRRAKLLESLGPDEILRRRKARLMKAGPDEYLKAMDERRMTPEQVERKRQQERERARKQRQAEAGPEGK